MTRICPTCGCSLVRLAIVRADATAYVQDGEELLFCCAGCVELFRAQPGTYLDVVRDWVVCPVCLAEKPKGLTVTIEHAGETVHLCRCPCCCNASRRDPDRWLRRLAA